MRLPDRMMERPVVAPAAGAIDEIRVAVGETIEAEGGAGPLNEPGPRR